MLDFLAALPECAQVIVPEASEAAMRYYNSGNILWIVNQAWGLIVPLLFLLWGFTGKLSGFAQRLGKKWYFVIVIYLVLYLTISQILGFPLDYYAGYLRQHAYGLSIETLGHWFSNYGKSFLVSLITAAAFIWIFYLVLKKSPRRWWFYGTLVSIGIVFITSMIQPIWIDPLFNKFGPMKDKQLEQQILTLAAKAGIQGGRVFEVDKSQETKALNAYVVGFGSTKRIVLWDTTLKAMTPDQILFVVGHEMGHYVLNHMWWGMAYYSALSFVIFYLTYRSANYLMKRYRHRFGFNSLSNIASFPLFLLLIGIFMLLATPLNNYFSRHLEHEADRFGLEITQNNQAAGEAFIVLQHGNLANPRPGPIYNFWRNTHPPLGERVDFCNSYCPWKEQEPLKYGKYFKE
ncbi:MAG TPA: M48 family metallopeptidase [Rhabdochlamydiaceae bacterium]